MSLDKTATQKLVPTIWGRVLGLPIGAVPGSCYVVDIDVVLCTYRDGYEVRAARYTRRPNGTYLMRHGQWRARWVYLDYREMLIARERKSVLVEYVAGRLLALARMLFSPKPDTWRLFGRGAKPFKRLRPRRVQEWTLPHQEAA